jgi:hypothetical protein
MRRMVRLSIFACCVAVLHLGVLLCEGQAQAVGEAPRYRSLRFEEDWSVLRRGGTGDLFDPVKYVELSPGGHVWASFGGQLRERVEVWESFNFGATGDADDDDIFLLHRLRLHADLHAGEIFRAFVEVKNSLSTDRDLQGGTRTLDEDVVDIQNGFLDARLPLGDGSFTLRGGRQELLFGGERLVSPLDWTNTRRTFDGVSGIWNLLDWRTHGFYTRPVEIKRTSFNDADDDQKFFGLYATGPQPFGPAGPTGLDLYWLGLHRDDAVFNGTTGDEKRHTLGLRIWGPMVGGTFDYEVEGAYQFGEVGDADVCAFMVVSEIGLNFPDMQGTPRLAIGLDYASGDDDAGDDDVETFNQLFPLSHKYLGYIDVIGRQNIVDLRGHTSFVPFRTLRAGIDLHYFRRASEDDALYNAQGAVVRAGDASDAREVGSEIDLTLRQAIGAHWDVLFGYSHFFAGNFIDRSGPDEDIDFLYLQGQFTF